MKLGITVAALAMIGAAASSAALAQGERKDLPHALTAPKASSSLMRPKASKKLTVSFQAKGDSDHKMVAPPPTVAPAK